MHSVGMICGCAEYSAVADDDSAHVLSMRDVRRLCYQSHRENLYDMDKHTNVFVTFYSSLGKIHFIYYFNYRHNRQNRHRRLNSTNQGRHLNIIVLNPYKYVSCANILCKSPTVSYTFATGIFIFQSSRLLCTTYST